MRLRSQDRRSRTASALVLLSALLVATGSAGARAAGPGGRDPALEATEALVRARYFEGLPIEQARALDDAAGTRLAGMLADELEVAHHANIVQALGLCACGPALEALSTFAAKPRAGELTRDDYRAWSALPSAMGHLARSDARALEWLSGHARTQQPARPFHHAHHDGTKLSRQRRLAAIDAIALAGNAQAEVVLREIEQQPAVAADAGLARRVAHARRRCARIAAQGIAALDEGSR